MELGVMFAGTAMNLSASAVVAAGGCIAAAEEYMERASWTVADRMVVEAKDSLA